MIPNWASNYVGIPYVASGRTREGADCYGLVYIVLREVFQAIVPPYDNSDDSKADRFLAGTHANEWIEVKEPVAGDVVLLAIAGEPAHCGIIVDAGVMLHAVENVASCIERTDGIRWAKRVQAYYRHRDLFG